MPAITTTVVDKEVALLASRKAQSGEGKLSKDTINRYLAETNNNPKPFTWTADPDAIIEKVRRGKQALESIH